MLGSEVEGLKAAKEEALQAAVRLQAQLATAASTASADAKVHNNTLRPSSVTSLLVQAAA